MADEEKMEDQEDEEIVRIPVVIENVQQDDIWDAPQYYANYVEIHTGGTDFRLAFYVRGPKTYPNGNTVEYRQAQVSVRIPREMLGPVRAIIDSQIEQIEQKEKEEGGGNET